MNSPTVTWPQLKGFLETLGIATHDIRDVHFELGRVTVTRRCRLPEGVTPMSEESLWEIETYPMVREAA